MVTPTPLTLLPDRAQVQVFLGLGLGKDDFIGIPHSDKWRRGILYDLRHTIFLYSCDLRPLRLRHACRSPSEKSAISSFDTSSRRKTLKKRRILSISWAAKFFTSTACFSAGRCCINSASCSRRLAIISVSCSAISGRLSSKGSMSSLVISYTSASVSAFTVAERGSPVNRGISPKNWPGLISATLRRVPDSACA